MAVTDAYFTAAEYRSRIGKDDTSDDADILTDGKAICRHIERKTERFFTKDASDATRVYDPRMPGRHLYTDDIVSVTSITVDTDSDGSFADETALATTDYELRPLNAADGPEPAPYTQVYIPEWSTASLWMPGKRVQIVGIFGWNAVPEAVKAAAIHLTAVLRLETPRASRSIDDTGQILEASYEARGIIAELVRNYGKVTF